MYWYGIYEPGSISSPRHDMSGYMLVARNVHHGSSTWAWASIRTVWMLGPIWLLPGVCIYHGRSVLVHWGLNNVVPVIRIYRCLKPQKL